VLSTGGRSFTYDSENRLAGMNGGAAGSQVAIQYDGWGNRVAETANGTTTRYLVDDLNPTGYAQVVEELVNGAVTRRYAYGFQRISETQLANNAWTPSFYGYDGGGSVRQLTNPAGAVTDTYSYDAFGNLLSSTGTTPNHYLYRDEQYDQALDLYYLRARHYNPTTGRFMGRDAADGDLETPASLHKYAYASGNPVNQIDPSGSDAVADYGSVTLNISLSRAVITGLQVTAAAIACADLWIGTKAYAESVAGPLGHVVTFPCGAIAIRNPAPPAIAPPLVYPVIAGTAPGPDGECGPGEELHHMLPQASSHRSHDT